LSLLQHIASKVSESFGRDSVPIRLLRPSYEYLLDLATGGRGYLRTINGRERFYVNPKYRGAFPGVYEPQVMEYLRTRVHAGCLSLNVGANVGVYALCLAEWSKPDGQVFAFEPNPTSRRLLEDHVSRNRCRVVVQPEAVGSRLGSATLFAAGMSGTSRLDQPNPGAGPMPHAPVTVPMTTLDYFCAQQRVSPDWVVMDIEGYEVAALQGARETVRAGRGHLGIVVEMHPELWEVSGTSRAELEELLNDLGLRLLGLSGQSDALAQDGMVALEYS